MTVRSIAFRTARLPQPSRSTPAAAITRLTARIGADDFYREVAKLDPVNGAKWNKIAEVQKRFQDAEAGYRNPAARTYSESNRETLHRLTILLLQDRRPGQNLYQDFIELHPALFKENGACNLPPHDQARILWNTDPDMLFSAENPALLSSGLVDDEKWIRLVQQAADETRAARRARGLPVTVSGYR